MKTEGDGKYIEQFKVFFSTNGVKIFVDASDYDEVMKYRWYAKFDKKRKAYQVYATSRIWLSKLVMKTRRLIDHVDNNGLNNVKKNLRVSTYQQNAFNTFKKSNSSSKYKGVHKVIKKWVKKPRGKKIWKVCIRRGKNVEGKRNALYLGYFASEVEAALAYDEAARKLHGEFARLNFPRDGEQSALCGEVITQVVAVQTPMRLNAHGEKVGQKVSEG